MPRVAQDRSRSAATATRVGVGHGPGHCRPLHIAHRLPPALPSLARCAQPRPSVRAADARSRHQYGTEQRGALISWRYAPAPSAQPAALAAASVAGTRECRFDPSGLLAPPGPRGDKGQEKGWTRGGDASGGKDEEARRIDKARDLNGHVQQYTASGRQAPAHASTKSG
jgi:hypothetical protein